jgi:hypothetical protein
MNAKIKELQTLCDFYHLDLRVQYYEDHEVCFKGINDPEQEVFNITVWYPKKKEKRIFCIELNSCYEQWRGGQFTKEDMLLFLSIDDLSDEELNITQPKLVEEPKGEPK